ncbi:MAG: hypothetical protein ABI808_03580 [Pseudonocardiales bacterium]
MRDGLLVRGNTTAEELAAVVALISYLERPREPDRYGDWRRARLAALTPTRCRVWSENAR